MTAPATAERRQGVFGFMRRKANSVHNIDPSLWGVELPAVLHSLRDRLVFGAADDPDGLELVLRTGNR